MVTEEGRAAVLAACPEPDILINNAGGPPPGNFRDWSREDWIKALDANMLSAIFLTKAVIDGMIAPPVRAHRQHHQRGGEVADRHAGPLQRREVRA